MVQNWFRDTYQAILGSYRQMDLKGVYEGNNYYAYANSSPLKRIDPTGLTMEEIIKTNMQVKDMFPELRQRGSVSCGMMTDDDNVMGHTANWSGNIVVHQVYCVSKCLSRQRWEDLFFLLFHEGMHSTDPCWHTLAYWGADEENWHTGIYNRERLEREHATGFVRGAREYFSGQPMWGTPRLSPLNLDQLYEDFKNSSPDCCGR
jgi:hypothetical protein